MSKTGQNFLEMQTDAVDMTEAEFVAKWGGANRDIWHQLHWADPDPEPNWVYPGSDPQI